jgi:hypothetical protein
MISGAFSLSSVAGIRFSLRVAILENLCGTLQPARILARPFEVPFPVARESLSENCLNSHDTVSPASQSIPAGKYPTAQKSNRLTSGLSQSRRKYRVRLRKGQINFPQSGVFSGHAKTLRRLTGGELDRGSLLQARKDTTVVSEWSSSRSPTDLMPFSAASFVHAHSLDDTSITI